LDYVSWRMGAEGKEVVAVCKWLAPFGRSMTRFAL
jgi:hypothetical protein